MSILKRVRYFHAPLDIVMGNDMPAASPRDVGNLGLPCDTERIHIVCFILCLFICSIGQP
jgi:hypothetical protein